MIETQRKMLVVLTSVAFAFVTLGEEGLAQEDADGDGVSERAGSPTILIVNQSGNPDMYPSSIIGPIPGGILQPNDPRYRVAIGRRPQVRNRRHVVWLIVNDEISIGCERFVSRRVYRPGPKRVHPISCRGGVEYRFSETLSAFADGRYTWADGSDITFAKIRIGLGISL